MSALDTANITSLPENAYYIPNFITVDEEGQILQKVHICGAPSIFKFRSKLTNIDILCPHPKMDPTLSSTTSDMAICVDGIKYPSSSALAYLAARSYHQS